VAFAVTSCPRCGKSKITQVPSKTTGCPWCGKKYAASNASKRAYETLTQARVALAAISDGKKHDAGDVVIDAPLAKTAGRTPIERIVTVAEELTKDGGGFGEDEFAARAKSEGVANPQSALKKLIDCGYVYEVRAGRYKSI